MRLLKRFLQRLVIFGLGIFSVWLIVFVVFETADRRLPWIWLWASLMDLPRMLFCRALFAWVLKSFSANGCRVTQSRAMDCLETLSTSRS